MPIGVFRCRVGCTRWRVAATSDLVHSAFPRSGRPNSRTTSVGSWATDAYRATSITTVYGTAEEQEHILPKHRELAAWMNGDDESKPSVQANGTVQLRQSRRVIARFFEALGVSRKKSAEKIVPEAIYQAPAEIVASLLAGSLRRRRLRLRRRQQPVRRPGLDVRGASASACSGCSTMFGIFSRIYDDAASAGVHFPVRHERTGVRSTIREFRSLRPANQ